MRMRIAVHRPGLAPRQRLLGHGGDPLVVHGRPSQPPSRGAADQRPHGLSPQKRRGWGQPAARRDGSTLCQRLASGLANLGRSLRTGPLIQAALTQGTLIQAQDSPHPGPARWRPGLWRPGRRG